MKVLFDFINVLRKDFIMNVSCTICSKVFPENTMHTHKYRTQEYSGAVPQVEIEYRCKACLAEAIRLDLPMPQSQLISENNRGW